MSQAELLEAVQGLLNGKNPKEGLRSGQNANALALALSDRIDDGVAPSHCAHAMCCSSNSGIVPVVRMLSARPMITFNKACHFGEPLRRACRAFVREEDIKRQQALGECALLIMDSAPLGSLDQPDKYLKSGLSASGALSQCGSSAALALLSTLRERGATSLDATATCTGTTKSPQKNATIKTEQIMPRVNNNRKRKKVKISTDEQASHESCTRSTRVKRERGKVLV